MMPEPGAAPSLAGSSEDHVVPDDLIGHLYRAGERTVVEMTAAFSSAERANLAAHCYRKVHLHAIGLAIAGTCDQATLMLTLGTVLGTVLFTQSRTRPVVAERVWGGQRPRVTLARPVGPRADAAWSERGAPVDAVA